jgi:hypothetical protein
MVGKLFEWIASLFIIHPWEWKAVWDKLMTNTKERREEKTRLGRQRDCTELTTNQQTNKTKSKVL